MLAQRRSLTLMRDAPEAAGQNRRRSGGVAEGSATVWQPWPEKPNGVPVYRRVAATAFRCLPITGLHLAQPVAPRERLDGRGGLAACGTRGCQISNKHLACSVDLCAGEGHCIDELLDGIKVSEFIVSVAC